MLAKSWKRIGLIILIIACTWNIVVKLINIISFDKAINQIKAQIQTLQNKDNTEEEKKNDESTKTENLNKTR